MLGLGKTHPAPGADKVFVPVTSSFISTLRFDILMIFLMYICRFTTRWLGIFIGWGGGEKCPPP